MKRLQDVVADAEVDVELHKGSTIQAVIDEKWRAAFRRLVRTAIDHYADRFGLKVADLHTRALQWSQLRGSRSGRVAWQFIRDLAGELGKRLPF